MYQQVKLRIKNLILYLRSFQEQYKREIFLSKYVFVLCAICLAFSTSRMIDQIVVSNIELLIIILITNIIGKKNTKIAYLFNSIAVLLILLEQFFLYFAGTYLSMIMLSNVDSIGALSDKLPIYILFILIIVLVSFFPIVVYEIDLNVQLICCFLLLVGEIAIFRTSISTTSPFYNFYILAKEKNEYDEIRKRLAEEGNENLSKFHKNEITDYRIGNQYEKQPNVVLIFVEGLSQSIIDDEKELLPNVKAIQEKSINFTNYYNHTFATYRGLIGQLYSGYQFDNYEKNNLVSLQEIMGKNGYETYFLNTEPQNSTFTEYLENMEFDKVLTLEETKEDVSDKQAFELLYSTLTERSEESNPIFLSMYTFGTHIGLDSPDEQYGDGLNPILNRFKNFDVQFSNFVKKMNEVGGFENTILVFTTDHATYVDEEYVKHFPSRSYGSFDKVPFFIYSEGIVPENINVNGRNSLALAPTILDFLDVSEENYFLGTSLFSNNTYNEVETIYSSELNYLTSKDNVINFLNEAKENEVSGIIEDYYSAKLFGVR